jgi:hypothetical protein
MDTTHFHESGHAIAFLSGGTRVDHLEVFVLEGGGICTPGTLGSPETRCRAALVGAAAESLGGGNGEIPSSEDYRVLAAAARELGIMTTPASRRAVHNDASRFVGVHEYEIRWLAAKLEQAGRLDRNAIASLCREKGSPLAKYAWLYPPETKPTTSLAPRGRVSSEWHTVSCPAF